MAGRPKGQRTSRFVRIGIEQLESRIVPTGDCYANLFAGPRLVSVDSNQSELLEGVSNALLPGSHVDLAVLDWNAIANGNVNLTSMLGALAADLGVSTPAEALSANVTLAQIFNATADAVPADGATAALHFALLDLSGDVDVPALSAPVQLGNLLSVTFPDGSFANADLNGLNLVVGAIQLYNYQNVATTTDPVTVSGTVLGLPGIVNSVEFYAQVVEPPIIDPVIYVGDQFYSAAMRLKLNVELVDFTAPGDASVTITQMQAYADVARAQGQVTLIGFIGALQKVTVQATPGVADVYVGSISDALFFNRTQQVTPAMLDFGTIGTVTTTDALGLPLTLDLEAKGYAQGTAPVAGTTLEFFAPFPKSQTTGTSAAFIANAVDDVLTSLEVRTTLNGTVVPDPTSTLRQTTADAIRQPLTAILSGGVDPLLNLLGTGIGEMDVTINATQCPPDAVDDAYTTAEDTPLTVAAPGVLSNDTDPDGDTLTVTANTNPANGSVALNQDGSFTYTPNQNFFGTDTFIYTISDGHGGTDTATVTVTVTSVDDVPVAVNDSFTTDEDTPVSGNLAVNDTPSGDGGNVWSLETGAAHGDVTVNANGTFNYSPDTNYNGPDSFTYKITDADGDTSTATVSITVNPVQDPPDAVDDAYTTSEDTPLIVAAPGVLNNDTDPDGDALTVTANTNPANGSVALNQDGSFTYTPNQDFNGTDTFTYTISDGHGGTDTATVTITVTPVDDVPVAVNDSATTNEDTPISGNLAVNDTPSGDGGNVWSLVTGAAHGNVTVNANGTFSYSPATNYNGPDSFTYKITDADGDTSTATVSITVSPVQDPPGGAPDAVNDAYTTSEDTALTVAAPGVLSNDTDPDGDTLTVTANTNPANGSVAVNQDGSFTYTPNQNFFGTDTFIYTISDGHGGTDTATVTVTVTSVDDVPVAVDDSFTTDEDTPVSGNLAANDTPSGDGGNVWSLETGAAHGDVTVNANGTFNYSPAANYNGPDSFTYKITDADGDVSTATVSITVSPVQDPPDAVDDTATTPEDTPVTVVVLNNDSDPDGDPLTVTAASDPVNGSVVINPNGTITYTPDANFHGTDTFTYTISDGQGGTDTATVTITVTSVDDVPVAVDDSFTTNEDTPVSGNLAANDTPSGDGGNVWSLETGATHGSVTVNANGTFSYSPAANYNGPDSFTYKITDADGDTSTATVSITVSPVQDPPDAAADTAKTPEGTPVTVAVLNNDSDPDGDTLTVTAASDPANGSVVINPDGTITYTPDANFHGTDTFTYTISDGKGGTDTATVTITVARPRASLSGFSYLDSNNDGSKQSGERGIAGVRIRLQMLVAGRWITVRTVFTDANGLYAFNDLLPGTYKVIESQPRGYRDGKDTLGTVGGVTRGSKPANDQFIVTLNAGESGVNYNFGNSAVGVGAGGPPSKRNLLTGNF